MHGIQWCSYGRAHPSLILQEELCIKCYSRIDDKIPLHGLDLNTIDVGFRFIMEQMTYTH